MSDLGLNKIMAAGLATGLALMGLNELSHSYFDHKAPKEPGYFVEVVEAPSGGDDKPAWVPPVDYGVLLASADIAKGQKKSAACLACHSFEAGGANGTGPALYEVVNRDVGSVGGFTYSAALSEMEGNWDFASLDGFLKNPKKYAKGTNMNYAGLSKEADRMNMIAYLRSLSAAPAALPAPLPPEAFIEPVEGEEVSVEAVVETVEEAAAPLVEEASAVVEQAETVAEDVAEEAAAEAEKILDAVNSIPQE
jgi:cytochrome c